MPIPGRFCVAGRSALGRCDPRGALKRVEQTLVPQGVHCLLLFDKEFLFVGSFRLESQSASLCDLLL